MTFMRRLRGLKRSSRGQSVVEFAMVLPLMLVVVFMVTEFGRALWIKNTLTQAAREGVRAAVVAGVNDSQKLDRAKARAEEFLTEVGMLGPDAPTPLPVVTATQFSVSDDDYLRVVITNDFNFIPSGPLNGGAFGSDGASQIIPSSIPIRAEAVMKWE